MGCSMYKRCARMTSFKVESIIELDTRAGAKQSDSAPIELDRFSEKVVQGPSKFATSRCANKKAEKLNSLASLFRFASRSASRRRY